MDELKNDIVQLCQRHPKGLPLLKIPMFYRLKYKKTLDLGPNGLSELECILGSMSDRLILEYSQSGMTVRPVNFEQMPETSASGSPPESPVKDPPSTTNDSNKGVLLQLLCAELVALLCDAPEGVELQRVRRRYKELYGRRLNLSDYGLKGLQDLLAALGDGVCVEHRDGKNVLRAAGQYDSRQAPAHAFSGCNGRNHLKISNAGGKLPKRTDMEGVCLDVVELVKLHPEGVPIKALANAFSRKYKRNLVVSRLGFSSIASFVQSLRDQLHVEQEVVFHTMHRSAVMSQQQGPADPSEASNGFEGPLPESSSASPGLQDVNLTQEQLLKNVLDVTKVFPLASQSIDELQKGYFLLFHTALPLKQYKSLYKKHTEKSAAGEVQPAVESNGASPQCPGYPTVALKQEAVKDGEVAQPASVIERVLVNGTPHLKEGSLAASGADPDLDFPALGTTLTPTQEKRLKEKASNAVVFRSSYHAQLREVHASNVRAREALGEEYKINKGPKRAFNPEEVNSLAEDVIRALAAKGELVTIEKVISRICRHLQIQSLQSVRIDPRHDLGAIKELQRSFKEINLFIECAEAVNSICTLYELGQSLAGLKNKKRFEELNLGPLCQFPIIHRLFKIDSATKDDDIPRIETVDILRSLRDYRRKQCRGPERVDLADFMKHLADQYNCESPYQLGIRILGLGLPISTLGKAVKGEHGSMDKAKDTIQKEIEEEVSDKMWKIKKSLLEPAQGSTPFSSAGSLELRKKYASLTAAEAVLQVFKNAEGVFSSSMTKNVRSFLTQVSGNRMATALFQLAICCGSLEVPQDLAFKEKSQLPELEKKGQELSRTPPPSEAAVQRYFQQCVSGLRGLLTLPRVSKLEENVTKHFEFNEFTQLEQGTFLEFLVKQTQVLQEAGVSSLSLTGQDSRACGFRPSQQDVFEFIKQCGVEDQAMLPSIEHALRSHYKIKDSRELGFGQLSTLFGLVQRQKDLSDQVHASPIRYETSLFMKESRGGAEETVGLLGSVTRGQALASLLSAPLLEDLAEWADWELVFQPQYGPLKNFIEKNSGANSDLAALEVRPGLLLRVAPYSSDKMFSEAVLALDPVLTAGHLVSIAVADGISNTPAALLANHMESSLAAAIVQEDMSHADDAKSFKTVAKFILDCLVRMPTRICKALFPQVFLEPLSRVLGQARSKAVLLQAAKSDLRYLNRLHHVGILLGVTEWAKDFHAKMNPLERPTVPSPVKKLRAADSESRTPPMVGPCKDFTGDSETDQGSVSESSSLSQAGDNDDSAENLELAPEQSGGRWGSAESLNGVDQDPGRDRPRRNGTDEEEAGRDGEEDRLSQCQAVIEDIRKSEFGIGVELNEEGQQLMRVHQERLGRSLERLSTELYSKDTHFVLELIQNADDNSYPVDGDVWPALAFVVERDCITILNNESGFEERNVRAICDVGRSTKGKHKHGYIGQKGIGFKSVFKVTDCPEIHSNDFHICFDKNSGPMGYILPHWIEDERPICTDVAELSQRSWTTKISLPLRSESYQTGNLFHDVHPSLLLFLHRLRSITIVNQSERRVVSMSRRDVGHSVLEVRHTDGVERWLVVKRMLFPKKIKEDVESTELALAFRLQEDVQFQPEKQPVFAFLPLRSFGFRFIVQGDFDIPSSREDVDRDSRWNQWLRSEIPQLFLHAMDVFTEHPEFSGLHGLCHILQFIPHPDEILDFFNPVAGQIIQLLKGKPCLPTMMDKDGVVEFKLPSQIAVSPDPLIQEVIGADLLHRHLNLSYLHPSLQSALSPSLVSALGVHRLSGSDISTITRAIARELVEDGATCSESCIKTLATLLVCNFRALERDYSEADVILQALRDIPIIPLADGRIVAQSAEGVFFPLMDEKSSYTGLDSVYKDLGTVSPRLLTCLDPLECSLVREMLKRLEVHEMQPQKVLKEHIYPILESGAWKTKPEDIVISYVVFIKRHSQKQDYMTLSAGIPVLTNKGFFCPGKSKVQFSKEYGNIDLPTSLPGVEWVLLHPCYLEADKDPSGWREFFSVLGVRDLLIFRKEKHSMSSKELRPFVLGELVGGRGEAFAYWPAPLRRAIALEHVNLSPIKASSLWAEDSKQWPRTADGVYVVEDYECEEFHSLVTADQLPEKKKLEQRLELLTLLDKNWVTGDKYSQYLRCQVLDSQGRPQWETRSSFSNFLTTLSWVPAFRWQPGDTDKHSTEYLCPSAVYLYSAELYSLLGIHVSYVKLGPSDFSTAIGMKHSVSVKDVIWHLTTWCTKAQDSCPEWEAEGADFCTTAEHMHKVYSYLHENCSGTQLKSLFEQKPAVFIEYERDGDWSSGKFYPLKGVCWKDPTRMFLRYKELVRKRDSLVQEPRFLAPVYGRLKDMMDFFLQLLNVEPCPSMRQYVDLLELICGSAQPTGQLLQDVLVIFAKLADICKIPLSGEQDYDTQLEPNYCMSLKKMLTDKKVFPTKNNCWVTLGQCPLIPDNRTLEKVFRSYSEVYLLKLSPDKQADSREEFSKDDLGSFLEICGVKKLSQCITTEAQTENYRPCPPMQILVRRLIPYIQGFLFHHEEGAYKELQQNNVSKLIGAMSFGQVGKLYIQYQLSLPGLEPVFESEDVICLLKDNKELYIQKDHLSAKLDICREMVKLFSTEHSSGDNLERFMQDLISCLDDDAALKRFLCRKDIQDLPDDEEKWEVPEPLEMRPEPPVFKFSQGGSAVAEEHITEPRDGETLACWPPKSSIYKSLGSHTVDQGKAVEDVMKMWPPPAPPAPADRESRQGRSGHDPKEELPLQRGEGHHHHHNLCNSHSADKGHEASVPSAVTQPCEASASNAIEARPESASSDISWPAQHTAALTQASVHSSHQNMPSTVPGAAPSVFQGNGNVKRGPMALDHPVWSKQLPPQAVLEDLVLDCSRPQTVIFTDEPGDTERIGQWGEQLVYAFLTHWKESGSPDCPVDITWFNCDGEGGQPFDFKVSFTTQTDTPHEVFVEVKATVKSDKHFVRLSANELDLALKKKENYHIYRVYNAGDSERVRLCRIQNLAQHLHSKDLELLVFL